MPKQPNGSAMGCAAVMFYMCDCCTPGACMATSTYNCHVLLQVQCILLSCILSWRTDADSRDRTVLSGPMDPIKDLVCFTSHAQTIVATLSPMQWNLTLLLLSWYDEDSCSHFARLNRLFTLGGQQKQLLMPAKHRFGQLCQIP